MNNILITSAGRRVSLVRSFQSEAKNVIPSAKVFTSDQFPDISPACRIADSYFASCSLSDKNYIAELIRLCKENKVRLVIPTIDTELLLLSKNKILFEREGIQLLISDESFISICRNKSETHKFFIAHDFNVPKSINRINPEQFPVFVKPVDGSSSINIHIIKDHSSLSSQLVNDENLMFLEYLDPKNFTEFTCDLYFNKTGQLKCIVPRQRIATRSGEVSKGVTRKNFLINFIYERINEIKGACGCLTLQVFVNNNSNEVYGIEINPRFGGGYPLSYLAGANFTKWILEECFLEKEIVYFDGWEDNLLMLRYDAEILVHDFKTE